MCADNLTTYFPKRYASGLVKEGLAGRFSGFWRYVDRRGRNRGVRCFCRWYRHIEGAAEGDGLRSKQSFKT